MPAHSVHLRNFTDAELILDEADTRAILAFFFPTELARIDSAEITRELRALAQGLLVEAVDASFVIGWVEQIFRWSTNPGAGVKAALRKLAMRGARHWFKHLKNEALTDAAIYERVRDQLGRNFRSALLIVLLARDERAGGISPGAFVQYDAPGLLEKVWG